MIPLRSALYVGEVTHRRTRPRTHALRYRIFMLLLDLDELAILPKRLRGLAMGAFGLLSFQERDHGDRSGSPLKPQIEARLAQAGIGGGGPILLLCMPRVLGYGFNPLSVYFCHGPDERLVAVLYEVTNTFGERHSYLIPCDAAEGAVIHQTASKRFHVSPFMDMALAYRFAIKAPDEAVHVKVAVDDPDGLLLSTAFVGRRRPLTDAALARAWATHPLLTLKVIGAIHWEAVKLWLKGIGYRPKPPPPAGPVTLGAQRSRAAGSDVIEKRSSAHA